MSEAYALLDTGFATKPARALAMLDRTRDAGVLFARVAAGSVYGTGEIEMALRQAGKGHVCGVNAVRQFNSWAPSPRLPESWP